MTQRMPSAPQTNRLAWGLAAVLATAVFGGLGLLVFQRISFNYRQNALEDAIWKCQVGQVRSLLERGAGVNTPSRVGGTLVELAIIGKRKDVSADIVKLLLSHGARLQSSDLSLAATWADAQVVRMLLAHGAKVNTRVAIDGSTPLIDAAMWAHLHPGTTAIIEALLAAGADPNVHLKHSGMTALMWAAYNGQTALAQILIAHGADVNARPTEGMTALMTAGHRGQTATAECLIVHGAAINARSTRGKTALMYAAEYGRAPLVKLLLAHGADLTPRESRKGRTALALARKYGHTAVVRLLQQSGAKG